MRLATSKGARVVWVGLPIVSDKGRWGIVERQNDRLRQLGRGRRRRDVRGHLGHVRVARRRLHGVLSRRDTVELIRESDGLHFNATGYELLARAVLTVAEQEFQLTPRVVAG